MGYIKTKGIIIREVNTEEADRVVTILCKGYGKVTGYAKSGRRPRSKLFAGTQFLCYSDFILFKGRDMYTITNCEVIEPFYEIRNDVIKLTYSAYIVDIVNDIVQEGQSSPRILQLFLNTIYMLAKTDKSPELIARVFELRSMAILGYTPYVRGCIVCDREIEEDVFFSFKKCGFICGGCKRETDPGSMEITAGAAKTINYIMYAPMKELFNFEVSPVVLRELEMVSRRYLRDRLERDYNKLDFLKSLK